MTTPTNPNTQTAQKAIAIIDAQMNDATRHAFEGFTSTLKFDAEIGYLRQLLSRSPQLAVATVANPRSLGVAMLDLAKMGLSLSPVLGQAYLKPQRPYQGAEVEIWAVPSYKGLQTCALRSGAVKSIITELVYANDTFNRGVTTGGPYMQFEMATGDRGALLGGFCLTRMANDETMVEWMDAAELEGCKLAATNAAGGKVPFTWTGPFRGEMYKKCISRRASKHWQIDMETSGPLVAALSRVDSDVGLPEFTNPEDDGEAVSAVCIGDADIATIRAALPLLKNDLQDLWMLRKAQAMGFQSIRDVPNDRTQEIADSLASRAANLQAAQAGEPLTQPAAPAAPPPETPAKETAKPRKARAAAPVAPSAPPKDVPTQGYAPVAAPPTTPAPAAAGPIGVPPEPEPPAGSGVETLLDRAAARRKRRAQQS